ncbi:hypothetical protein [Bacillus phage CM1]|nr:hypothetical protein [Bacillus phage CM1]
MISFKDRHTAHFIFVEQLDGKFVIDKDSRELFVVNKADRTNVEHALRNGQHRVLVWDVDGNLKAKNYL